MNSTILPFRHENERTPLSKVHPLVRFLVPFILIIAYLDMNHCILILIGLKNKSSQQNRLRIQEGFFAFRAMAIDIVVPNKAEPPAETNGKGTPVIGTKPIFIPI